MSQQELAKKYKPKKIFYFSGQSSLTKSIENEKETFNSHFTGTKNFLVFLKKEKLDTKVCISCGRPFQWRKKWEKDWQKVKYCSNRCKKNK